jgi:hypothetical protein
MHSRAIESTSRLATDGCILENVSEVMPAFWKPLLDLAAPRGLDSQLIHFAVCNRGLNSDF